VAEDYYAAMDVVEKRLDVAPPEREGHTDPPINDDERAHLLDLAIQLAEPDLSVGTRLDLVDRMCQVLDHKTPMKERQPVEDENGKRPRAPP
jgi:hypothetical protein